MTASCNSHARKVKRRPTVSIHLFQFGSAGGKKNGHKRETKNHKQKTDEEEKDRQKQGGKKAKEAKTKPGFILTSQVTESLDFLGDIQ
jgi:hypothetical protein